VLAKVNLARRLGIVRQRIARVNASLASRSALRGIDPRDPPPKSWQLSTRRTRVRDDAGRPLCRRRDARNAL